MWGQHAGTSILGMFDALTREERLLLLRFVCAFAWTDLEVTPRERAFVERLVTRLGLDADDTAEVSSYLHVAPAPSSVHASAIPLEHRRAFVESVRGVIYADGRVDPEEREQFEKLQAALSS